jgi:hypothetical protein
MRALVANELRVRRVIVDWPRQGIQSLESTYSLEVRTGEEIEGRRVRTTHAAAYIDVGMAGDIHNGGKREKGVGGVVGGEGQWQWGIRGNEGVFMQQRRAAIVER